jgi:hypothetical protein
MDAYVRLFCVCIVLCVGSGLATGCSPVRGLLLTVYKIKKVRKRRRSKGLYSHRDITLYMKQIMAKTDETQEKTAINL